MRKLHLIILLVLIAFQGLISDELKLTHPNGGELIYSKTDTIITWEGIPHTANVKLTLSLNNGKTWSTIADSVSSLNYMWKTPFIESDSCLVRIKHSVLRESNKGEIEWAKSYFDSTSKVFDDLIQTSDGGFIATGWNNISYKPGSYSDIDLWIIKLDYMGNVEWSKTIGGSKSDRGNSIIETRDGGFLIGGRSLSSDRDLVNNYGWDDLWFLKINRFGGLIWSKTYGGSGRESLGSIIETNDGSIVAVGGSNSTDFDVPSSVKSNRVWILKMDSLGEIKRSKLIDKDGHSASSILNTKEGGYIIGGQHYKNYDSLGNSNNNIWISKLNSNFEEEWFEYYDNYKDDVMKSIKPTIDGGYILAGYNASDVLVIKLNENGKAEWTKTYGGADYDRAHSVAQFEDGTYSVVGFTKSKDRDITDFKGGSDFWILNLGKYGEIIWEKTIGGSGYEVADETIVTSDGGFLVAGNYGSIGGDFRDFIGDNTIIVKLSGAYKIQSDTSDAVFSIIAPDVDYYAYTNEQNSSVIVTAILEESTDITLEIYDVLGRRIVELYSGEAVMGKNEYTVNINDFQSGRYYIKLTTPTITKTEIIEVVR